MWSWRCSGGGGGGHRWDRPCCCCLVQVVVLTPVLVRVLAVHLGDKVADKGLLVEGSKVGAEEVVTEPGQTVMVELERD